MDRHDCEALETRPEVVSGAWVFRGTRIPIAALLLASHQSAGAQSTDQQIASLKTEVKELKTQVASNEAQIQSWLNYTDLSVPFLFAAVAGIWAQNTRRNTFLWLGFGFFLAPLAVIVILFKNRKKHPVPKPAVKPIKPAGNTPLVRQKLADPLAGDPQQ